MTRVGRISRVAAVLVSGGIVIGAGAAVATTTIVTKSGLPKSTSRDVQTALRRERAVSSQLQAFARLGKSASVAKWEAGLRSAESAQSAAAAVLANDLATSKKPSGGGSSGAAAGSTLSFKDGSGNPYNVEALKLIDPAQGADQFTTPNAGDRFVAIDFKITDTGQRQISDDANSDATVIGSDNQSYTADFDNVSECTNFSDGEYQLASHQSVTGCVVFQLPVSVKVVDVEWSPNGGFGGGFGEWKV